MEKDVLDVRHKVEKIHNHLQAAKAMELNRPHAELKDYVPFKCDLDILTVVNDKELSNQLYCKVYQ